MELSEVPVIGDIGPAADGLDEPYWDGLKRGELMMQRCARCERWSWPPLCICPDCHSFEFAWEPVSATGRIFSWTRTWHAFATEFTNHLPYTTVVVELPHAGSCRLVGLLLGTASSDDITIGSRVDGVIQQPTAITSGAAVLRWRLA